MIEAVDLFCGVGGLTAGLRAAGLQVHAGYDIDAACEYPYTYNNGASFVKKNVELVTAEEISNWYSGESTRLLAGCAPCQPFSSYNNGRDTRDDRKWPLLYAFSRLIREVQPELVTMENVPDVTKHEVYHDFVQELKDQDYEVWADRVSCVDYGLPQNRRRHVLLASKLGPISIIQATHADNPRTVKQTIGRLSRVEAGGAHKRDRLHRAQNLSETNMARIQASIPGGTWRDWPEELRAECHRRESGKTYPSVYGRMSWEEPSPTMTTLCYGFGNGRFGHPEQDRGMTLREAALLQSFPRDYRFVHPRQKVEFKPIGRMIGNAVPVRLGEVIGLSLVEHLNGVRAN